MKSDRQNIDRKIAMMRTFGFVSFAGILASTGLVIETILTNYI